MHGLHSQTKERIHKVVENLFDKTALRFLGPIAALAHKKHTLIGFETTLGLAALFVQAMNNRYINSLEQDVLKGILTGANNYIDILRDKTSNNIIQQIEGVARESRISGEKLDQSVIDKIVKDELGKASSSLETIIASESTKTRNLGATMEISRLAAQEGVKDPIVYFMGRNDASTCGQCVRLFFMSDGVTPRLWYISECSGGYFKRGDSVPSILGLHPRCVHSPVMLPSGWGFDKSGHITFIGLDYDAIKQQRNED